MIGKKWHLGLSLIAACLLCAENSNAAARGGEKRFKDIMTLTLVGTAPPVSTKHWIRIRAMNPRPPGGPTLYVVMTRPRKPRFDGYTYDVQVGLPGYHAILRFSKSYDCQPGLLKPEPAVLGITEYVGGREHDFCWISNIKACTYLTSVENLLGADRYGSIRDYFTNTRELFCR